MHVLSYKTFNQLYNYTFLLNNQYLNRPISYCQIVNFRKEVIRPPRKVWYIYAYICGLINRLMPGGNEKVKLKQTCTFQRVTFLLPPGIKGLMSGMSYDIQSELSFLFCNNIFNLVTFSERTDFQIKTLSMKNECSNKMVLLTGKLNCIA